MDVRKRQEIAFRCILTWISFLVLCIGAASAPINAHADAAVLLEKESEEGNRLAIAGQVAFDKGDLLESVQLLDLARRTFINDVGPMHQDAFAATLLLAVAYGRLNLPADARRLVEESITPMRAKLGPDHVLIKMATQILDDLYRVLGATTDALRLWEETYSQTRAKLGLDHADTLISMNNLANKYSSLGRHAEALKLREETLAIRRVKLGMNHPDTLSSISNLAMSYSALGRHTEALKLNEEALALRTITLGSNHPETFVSRNNLAVCYSASGRHTDALQLDEETLTLRRSILGSNHPDTLSSMINLANRYSSLGRIADAMKLREETQLLIEATLGPNHPDTLMSRNNLAVSYSAIGRHSDALTLDEETLKLRRAALGPNHPDTIMSMTNLAEDYRIADRRAESLALRRESLVAIDNMAGSLKALTRNERAAALAQYQDHYVNFAANLAEKAADISEALTVTERGKARSLLEELTSRQAITSSGIPKESAQRLSALSAQIELLDSKLANAPDESARQHLRPLRDAAAHERDVLHQSLMTEYPHYAMLSAIKPLSAAQGRALLPEGGVFISWLFDKESLGVAVVLPKIGDLKVVKVAPGVEILRSAETYRWLHALPDVSKLSEALREVPLAAWEEKGILYIGALDKKPSDAKSVAPADYLRLRPTAIAAHGRWLVNELLRPLAESIGTADRWVISPDGIFTTIPWDTLPWNEKLLGEQMQLTVTQSLSVYALLKERENVYTKERVAAKTVSRPLLAMGGAVYASAPSADRAGTFQRAPQPIGPATSATALEYQQQDAYRNMLSLVWRDLPGTVSEVEGLNALIGGSKLLGQDASEAKLRHLSQSGELAKYRNLHFAAHGYLNTSFPNLSALVLTKTGDDEANDGYITAGEWPAFNLKSDLMVLSACETGLGKVVSGEGVQGLPYALYVAGNRDTLLSLWKVDDLGTSVFMKRFWTKVKDGMNHAKALTETKREFMRGDAGAAYTDPYYWAPFILYGVQD